MLEIRSRVVEFFATPKDLEPGLKRIEQEQGLIYIHDPSGGYENKEIPVYHSAFEIPNWYVISQRTSETYIVMPNWAKPRISRWVYMGKGIRNRKKKEMLYFPFLILGIKLPGCVLRYRILHNSLPFVFCEKKNSSSIVYEPGGWFDNKVLVSGRISTILESKESKDLYQLFKSELFEGFVKVQSYSVGPEALCHLRNGIRLTPDVKSTTTLTED